MTRTSRTERKQRCRLTAPQDVYRLRRTGRVGSRTPTQSSAPRRHTRCLRIKSFRLFFVRIRKCFGKRMFGVRNKWGNHRNSEGTKGGVCHMQSTDLRTQKKGKFPRPRSFKSFDKKSGLRKSPIPIFVKPVSCGLRLIPRRRVFRSTEPDSARNRRSPRRLR